MAIIYTYPVKATPANDDLILISDSADSNSTKQVKVSSLPFTNNAGTVTSVGVSMPSAFAVASSPVTSSGTIAITTTGGSSGQYLAYDGTWGTPAGGAANAAGADTQVQYNDGGTNFGAGAFFTTNKSSKVDIIYELGLIGDGTSHGLLKIYCEAGTPHYVGIKGPNHTGGTPASYTIQLPNSLPSVANQILESNASGTLSWIATPSGSGGISFSGTTANGIATYSNSTTATVSSVFTVSGNKLSAPAGTKADPSIEVGAIGGLYAASGGITLAHNGSNAIGVNNSFIDNYKLTQFDNGLRFGSSGETLNSYEEGTWTPTSANANTISNVAGDYTRIGDRVFAEFSFTMTGSTTVAISGLPFQGVYSSSLKGGVIMSANSCTSVQGQLIGGQFSAVSSFTFNAYFGSGGGLPTQLRQVASSVYQTSGGTYAGIIIYETTA